MGDNVGTCIPIIEAQAQRQLLQTGRLAQEHEEDGNLKGDGFIAVIESHRFLRECIRRSMQPAFSLPIVTYSTLSELELGLKAASAAIVIVSWMEASNEARHEHAERLVGTGPECPGRRSCSEERRRPCANRHSSWREGIHSLHVGI